jgi:hypothetical protein
MNPSRILVTESQTGKRNTVFFELVLVVVVGFTLSSFKFQAFTLWFFISEYPRQLIQVLTTHNDVIVYAIAKNAAELSVLLAEYQNTLTVVPILLDVQRNDKDTRLLMKHLPKLDTIINLHGQTIVDKIPPKSFKYE